MTYQEIKDRLSKCELTLEKLKNGTIKPTEKVTVEKLQVLKESLEKLLAEDNAILTTKKGASKVVTGLNKRAIAQLKLDPNIDSIETTDGVEVKEMKPGDPEDLERKRFARLSPKDQKTIRKIQAMIAREKELKNESPDGPPIDKMTRADMIDFLNVTPDKVEKISDEELRDAVKDKNSDLREGKEGEVNVYGYQTKHFDICPGATALFKKMMSDNPISKYKPLYSDDAQAQMIKFAKLHDALFAIEKVVLKGVDKEKGSQLLDKAIEVADNIYELGQELGLDKEHRGQDLGYIQGHIEKINDAVRDVKEGDGMTTKIKPSEGDPTNMAYTDKVKEDMDVGHQDDEPSMLKSSAMETATYAAKLYKKLNRYDQFDGEVDFPNWWQKKLILARDYMSAAFHYLDSEEKQPALDKLALEENEIGDSGKDVGMGYENARDMIGYFREKIYPHMNDQELEEFRQVMFDHLKDAVAENVDKVAGGIPYKVQGSHAIINEPLDDATKERLIKRANQHGYHAAPNQAGGITINLKKGMNELKEATDLYDRNGIQITRFSGGKRGLMLQVMYKGQNILIPADEFSILARAMQSVIGDIRDMTRQVPRNEGSNHIQAQYDDLTQVVKNIAHVAEMSIEDAAHNAVGHIEDEFSIELNEDDNPVPQGKNIKVDDMQFMHDSIVSRMKKLAKIYKEKGPEATVMLGPNNDREVKVVDTLKILTKKKRELEDALQNKVAGIGVGQELDEGRGDEHMVHELIGDLFAPGNARFHLDMSVEKIAKALEDYQEGLTAQGVKDAMDLYDKLAADGTLEKEVKDGNGFIEPKHVPKLKKAFEQIGLYNDVDELVKKEEEEIAHDCASHVLHEKYGKGICIPEQHTLVKEGDKHVVTHYDVLFKEGKKVVKNIPVSELKIVTESHHGHKRRKK